jgi:catechol 2,3-dioxygenase-like lactoylglutathione lyase family enzyme
VVLGYHPIVAFVMTSDAARAKTFYGETLGLKFVSQDDYALVFDANGIMLRITVMPGHTPVEHAVLGWNVPDITATVKSLSTAGVQCEKYPFFEQDDLGIWTSPDGGAKVAFFKDPDGNVLSVGQIG